MATIINNPNGPERVVEIDRNDSGGWAVAVVILIVVIVGGVYAWYHYRSAAVATTSGSTNVNVTLPSTFATGTTTN